jgi:hypothetical protein
LPKRKRNGPILIVRASLSPTTETIAARTPVSINASLTLVTYIYSRAERTSRWGEASRMSSQVCEAKDTPPASIVLERLLAAMPQDRVSVGWLHEELREHSFEMLAFIMALIGVLPGASVMIGFLMVVPAFGMMFSSGMPLPSVVAARSISTRQASFILGRAIPILKTWESVDRSPQSDILRFARPVVGVLLLLLGITLLVPVPLSNVLPALTIAGLALASFEGNLMLLCISGAAAAGSLAFTGVTLLAASQAFAHFAL